MKIIVLGCASYDSIIYLKEFPASIPQTLIADSFHETVGSTGSGKALNLAGLGFDVDFHAMIGNDYYGKKIIDFLSKQENLNFFYTFDSKPTQRHCNIMNEHGQRISIFMQESSYNLKGNLIDVENSIEKADVIILNIAAYCKDYIPLIQKYHKPVWCDLHDYDEGNPYHKDFIDIADYLFMSSDNYPDYKTFMKKQIDAGKRLIVCTHGKEGASVLTSEGICFDIPIIPDYERVDTNGAGDSFMSGFMYGYYNNYDISQSMKLATVNGGLCINSPELVRENLTSELLISEYKKYYL